ncbi:retrovirus-related pol polyprotein from transposon TNT 1-94 [Tanacetum coccineum]
MDPMISLGQNNTLAEYMIISGADNRPPMLDKDLYDSWKSIMELYMQNREHGRMILELVEHGPLIWHTVKENGVIRTKKYAELSATEKIQADCDMKATNIILQGLPVDIYSLVNHHRVAKDSWERVQLLMQVGGGDLIALSQSSNGFSTDVASSRFPSTNNRIRTSSNLRNQATIQDGRVTVQQVQGRQGQNYSGTTYKGNATVQCTQPKSRNARVVLRRSVEFQSQAQTIIPHNVLFRLKDLDTYDSDCDDSRDCTSGFMRLSFPFMVLSFSQSHGYHTRGYTTSGHAIVVKCYNCQGEGHMARQCTQPKRPKNAAWYKEKAMLAEAQETGQILDEELLAFLADLRISASQA